MAPDSHSPFELRWPGRATAWIWGAWLLVCLALTAEPFVRHVRHYSNPGRIYFQALLVLLPVFTAAAACYLSLRRRSLWRREPLALALAAAAILLFYEPRATAAVAFLGAAWYAAGRRLRTLLGLETDSIAGEITFSAAMGCGLLMLLLLPLGWAGLYRWPVFAGLLGAALVVCRRELACLGGRLRDLERRWRQSPEMQQPLMGVAVVFAGCLTLCSLAVALAPAVAHDPIAFHLPLARFYSEAGRLTALPYLPYSYFPQGGEMLMAAAYSLGGRAAAQMVHPLLFALTLLAAFAAARRCGIGRMPAAAGITFAFSIPFVHWTGSVGKNDLLLAWFQLAALLCYLRARDSGKLRWLGVGAVFVAFSFWVKYIAAFGAAALALLYLWELRRRGALRLAPALLGVSLVIASPWPLRAYLATGNPIHPAELRQTAPQKPMPARGGQDRQPGGPSEPEVRKEKDPGGAAPETKASSDETARRERERFRRPALPLLYLQYPWIAHFRGWHVFESLTANPLGFFLVFFAPAWLLVRRGQAHPGERAGLVFAGVYLFWLGYVWLVVRYAIHPFVLLFVLTSGRAAALAESGGVWVRRSVAAAAFYVLLFGTLVTAILEINGPQLHYFAGRITAGKYVDEVLYSAPSLKYAASRTGPADLVLAVNNIAHLYGPRLDRLHSFYYRTPRHAARPHPVDSLPYTMMILPRNEVGRAFLANQRKPVRKSLLYEDARYRVYAIRQSPAADGG